MQSHAKQLKNGSKRTETGRNEVANRQAASRLAQRVCVVASGTGNGDGIGIGIKCNGHICVWRCLMNSASPCDKDKNNINL